MDYNNPGSGGKRKREQHEQNISPYHHQDDGESDDMPTSAQQLLLASNMLDAGELYFASGESSGRAANDNDYDYDEGEAAVVERCGPPLYALLRKEELMRHSPALLPNTYVRTPNPLKYCSPPRSDTHSATAGDNLQQTLQSSASQQQQSSLAETLFAYGNFPLVNQGAPLTYQTLPSQQAASTTANNGAPTSQLLVNNPLNPSPSAANNEPLHYPDPLSELSMDQRGATGTMMNHSNATAAAVLAATSSLEPTPLALLQAAAAPAYPGVHNNLNAPAHASQIPNLSIAIGGQSTGFSMGTHHQRPYDHGRAVAAAAAVTMANNMQESAAYSPQQQQHHQHQQPRAQNEKALTQPVATLPAMSTIVSDAVMANTISTATARKPPLTGRPPVVLYMPCDDAVISAYQCLARKQMELFEAKAVDVEAGAQGRNRGIVLGQVGVRCHHCAHVYPRRRTKSSTFYPSTLKSIYQTAQNMSNTHLTQTCQYIPASTREELQRLSLDKKTSAGGGKEYWSDGARILGVYETGTHLRFHQHNELYPGSTRGSGPQTN